ncbi:MAG: hypothetical protein AAGA48_04100 [Myxococcota bacterium]
MRVGSTQRFLEQRLLDHPTPEDWWVYADWLAEHEDPWVEVVRAGLSGRADLREFGLGPGGVRRLGAWARPVGARSSVNLYWQNGVRAELGREGPRSRAEAASTRFRLLDVGHVRDRLDELPPLPPATGSLGLFVSSAPSVRALAGLDLRRLKLSASLGQLDLCDLSSVGPLRDLGLDAFTVSLEPLAEVPLARLKLGPRVRASLEPLLQLPELVKLNLHHFQGYLEPLTALDQLRELTITYGKRGRDLTPLYGLPNVTALTVKGAGLHLAAGLPALTRLVVDDVDMSLHDLAGCGRLTHLRIVGHPGLRTLEGIERLERLEVLDVEDAGLVDVTAIVRAKTLRRIGIRRCPHLVDLAPLRMLEGVDVDVVGGIASQPA